MKVGSLFSGVGGMDLGLERAGMEVAWQVEIDPYCRRVLAKHWPDVERFDDVREVGQHNLRPVDLICGGFPCQDISNAGKRAGIEGERSGLWSEFARIVCELRPRYVLVENVAALLGRGMGRVLGDLAACGYDAEWDCIPALAVGAPHIRNRLFIVASRADADEHKHEGNAPENERETTAKLFSDAPNDRSGRRIEQPKGSEITRHVADTEGNGRIARRAGDASQEPGGRQPDRSGFVGDVPHSIFAGLEGTERGKLALADFRRSNTDAAESGWWSVEPDVGRVANGVPAAMDFTRLVGYIASHGSANESKMAEEGAKDGRSGSMRIMRLYLGLTTAPPKLENAVRGCSSLPEMPCEHRLCARPLGAWPEEEAAMCDLCELVSAAPLDPTQDMQPGMPVDPRTIQRWLAVGQRRDRLRGLGNAVVPQVAQWIGERIMHGEIVT